MRREADVKDKVKKILREYGKDVWWFMPVPTGFGIQGVPDFVCSVGGRFVGIETKFGSNGLTVHQVRQMEGIVDSGAAHMVINEKNVDQLKAIVDAILALEK